jgi:hypothetical protein
MSVSTALNYMGLIPKRPDITGEVFKFKNFLDQLIGGIKRNTIAVIGTINPGSLCIQYLYAPKIHYVSLDSPLHSLGTLPTRRESSVS